MEGPETQEWFLRWLEVEGVWLGWVRPRPDSEESRRWGRTSLSDYSRDLLQNSPEKCLGRRNPQPNLSGRYRSPVHPRSASRWPTPDFEVRPPRQGLASIELGFRQQFARSAQTYYREGKHGGTRDLQESPPTLEGLVPWWGRKAGPLGDDSQRFRVELKIGQSVRFLG